MLVLIGVLCWMFIGIYFFVHYAQRRDNSADQCAEKKEGWGGYSGLGGNAPPPHVAEVLVSSMYIYFFIFMILFTFTTHLEG